MDEIDAMGGPGTYGDDYTLVEDYVVGTLGGREVKCKDIKEIVGEALSEVDGILDLKNHFTDLFKSEEDLTRGISVSVNGSREVKVTAKIITDTAYDKSQIVEAAGELVSLALQNEAGLRPSCIAIEVVDSMSMAEYRRRFERKSPMH